MDTASAAAAAEIFAFEKVTVAFVKEAASTPAERSAAAAAAAAAASDSYVAVKNFLSAF